MLAEITEISAIARRTQFTSAGRCLKTDGQGRGEECGPILAAGDRTPAREGNNSEFVVRTTMSFDELHQTLLLESLILAQDERWRRA